MDDADILGSKQPIHKYCGNSSAIFAVSPDYRVLYYSIYYICEPETKNICMLQSIKNEFLVGIVISALLSLLANFALALTMLDSVSIFTKVDLLFSAFWLFFFSFVLFILYRWLYKWGNKKFPNNEQKAIVFALGITVIMACGLFSTSSTANTLCRNIIFPQADAIKMNIKLSDPTNSGTIKVEMSPAQRDTAQTEMAIVTSMKGNEDVRFSPNNYASGPNDLTRHLFVLTALLLSLFLIHQADKKQKMQLEFEQIKNEQLQSSYDALMGQINPHFFFNSLNGLNSLIRTGNQGRTIEYLEGLSNVFRYILQSNRKTFVSLDEELLFIKAYNYLLGIRYENKLFFNLEIDEDCTYKYLPVLSLLPLIENAVKHNVISKKYPMEIKIYTDSENMLIVSNPIRSKQSEYISTGIGLTNLQRRYQMLTGKNIKISDTNGYFEVSLPLLNSVEKH